MHIEHLKIKKVQRIYSVLLNIGQFYVPTLLEQVNSLENYSIKLANNAETFLAVEKGTDIGIISIYCNNLEVRKAFISTFGVDIDYSGKGISKVLLENALKFLKKIDFKILSLEVNKINYRAIGFYRKNGFSISENREKSYIMNLTL